MKQIIWLVLVLLLVGCGGEDSGGNESIIKNTGCQTGCNQYGSALVHQGLYSCLNSSVLFECLDRCNELYPMNY